MTKKKEETNSEFVCRLMDYSKGGALTQLFILKAMEYYAKDVEAMGEDDWPKGHLINLDAWKRVATDVLQGLEEHYEKRLG